MSMRWLALLWIVVPLLVPPAEAQSGKPSARAELKDAQGQKVGTLTLEETGDGMRVTASVTGLPPGTHGIHFHARGQCQAPKFESAGDHFNPAQREHGLQNPRGPHAGDLPNLEVRPDGTGRLEHVTREIALQPGAASVFDADGTAAVVHAKPDDQVSGPSGNSGDRIACGVVTKAS
jgi:Cu-Zn family superoxide dismutase